MFKESKDPEHFLAWMQTIDFTKDWKNVFTILGREIGSQAINLFFEQYQPAPPKSLLYERLVEDEQKAENPPINFPTVTPDNIEGRWNEDVLNNIGSNTAEKIKNIDDTTKDGIRNIVLDGVNNNKGAPDIADDIAAEYDNISEGRANTIARTEAVGIGTKASFMSASELFGDDAVKEWCATEDDNTRQGHQEVDGTQVKMNETFTVNVYKETKKGGAELIGTDEMQYPHDESASAGNIINCRCTILYPPPEAQTAIGTEGVTEEPEQLFGDIPLDKIPTDKEGMEKWLGTDAPTSDTELYG